MILVSKTVSSWANFYFYSIAFVGSFFLINLVMAVINFEFSKA